MGSRQVRQERGFGWSRGAPQRPHAGGCDLAASRRVVGGGDPLLAGRGRELAALALRHAMPAVGANSEFAAAGGLAGYSGRIIDAYRLNGVYTARILKGEKPGELPVQQSTKIEFSLNLKTAKSLGITVPLSLLDRADEVIEQLLCLLHSLTAACDPEPTLAGSKSRTA